MDDISLLEEKIESVRQEMYDAYLNGADDDDVLHISQKLDKLLNQLHSLL
ncbi:aspartyl-phosphate phosphatase Spo0E family protein [Halobacillus trueperi]|uniref:Aspartyl-phosphate phosphatase Spo0E family protein n=1 Tax=Halobacillus trueperi TaxID=156205 RepID=A0A3E0J8J5_9BACI|nr:aspartyl-phosphate phosphatase Spo0E family protein [Halobacillus trueperi]REJ09084.1 aspartyl-phosphate phosphatase Spo0E family protein [Halobacillus trueperi]